MSDYEAPAGYTDELDFADAYDYGDGSAEPAYQQYPADLWEEPEEASDPDYWPDSTGRDMVPDELADMLAEIKDEQTEQAVENFLSRQQHLDAMRRDAEYADAVEQARYEAQAYNAVRPVLDNLLDRHGKDVPQARADGRLEQYAGQLLEQGQRNLFARGEDPNTLVNPRAVDEAIQIAAQNLRWRAITDKALKIVGGD